MNITGNTFLILSYVYESCESLILIPQIPMLTVHAAACHKVLDYKQLVKNLNLVHFIRTGAVPLSQSFVQIDGNLNCDGE